MAVLALVGLTACGGGGASTSAPTVSAPASRATTPVAKAAPANSAAKAAPRRESPSPRDVRKAGRAAPFLTAVGDNSIPTYGSESSGTQQSQATAALRSYLAARAAGDWGTACSYMGAPVRKQIEVLGQGSKGKAKGCAGAYEMLSARVAKAERANPFSGALAALRVKSPHAFALFYGPHHQQYMMPMVSEGGAWKVNQIDPVPYPPGVPTTAAR